MGKALDFDSSIVGSNPATSIRSWLFEEEARWHILKYCVKDGIASIRDRLEQAGVILMVPCRDDASLNRFF